MVRLVLRQGMMLACSGVAIGLLLSVTASRPTSAKVNAHGFYWPLVALVTTSC